MLYKTICTMAPIKVKNPIITGISTADITAAFLVLVGEAPDPVTEPVPEAVVCTLVLPEAQKYAPLMILES